MAFFVLLLKDIQFFSESFPFLDEQLFEVCKK